jgi:hypothetical protein
VKALSPPAFGGFDDAIEEYAVVAATRRRCLLLAPIDADDVALPVHAGKLRPGGLHPGYSGKLWGNQRVRSAL